MIENAFINHPDAPTPEELAAALGAKEWKLWDRLLAELASEFGLTDTEWNSYSVKAGWALRVKKAKRNIVYLSPGTKLFATSFILGKKAVAAAQVSGLTPGVLKIIDESPRYPEGTGVRLEIRTLKDLDTVKKLVRCKLDN